MPVYAAFRKMTAYGSISFAVRPILMPSSFLEAVKQFRVDANIEACFICASLRGLASIFSRTSSISNFGRS